MNATDHPAAAPTWPGPESWDALVRLGFSVFPVESRGKRPLGVWKQYQERRPPSDLVRQWSAQPSNIGVVTGAVSSLLVLDLDSDDAIAEAERRGIPDTVEVTTGKGRHVYFRHSGGTVNNRAGLLPGMDIRGDGGYVVGPGSTHPSGTRYRWRNPPGLFELAHPPQWLLDLLDDGPGDKARFTGAPQDTAAYAKAALRGEIEGLVAAPEGRRNHTLNVAAMKLAQLVTGGQLEEDTVKARLHAAAAAIGLDTDEIALTIASGFAKGLREPRDSPERKERKRINAETAQGFDRTAEASEDAIALAFTAEYRDLLRFDHDAGRWFEWDGSRWRRNGTDLAFHCARKLGRAIGYGKRAMCKASVAGGAERFARADPAHALEASVWDADPMLLSTPGGTVDLTTGKLRAANPADLITKQTSATPQDGRPELWLRFLNEALGGDVEAVGFLQQWFGYCLTGDTRAHALLFLHGLAGTGKTVFLNTLQAVLGDYAVTAAMETFTASRYDRHSTELAMLRGARLVTASETEEGRSWAEARIKQMPGGRTCRVRAAAALLW